MGLSIIKGDILDLNYEAIVVPSTPNLDLDGAIGGEIKKICGRPLQVELSQLKKINQIGEAVITNAYNMKCKKLILVADPKWQGGNCHEEENLERSYLNALELADVFNVNGVAFPILSTGVYQFPKKRAIEIAIKTIKKFLRDGDLSVALVVYDADTFEKYQKLFSKFTIVDGKLVDGEKLPGCFMEIKRNRGWYGRRTVDVLENRSNKKSFAETLEYFRIQHAKSHSDTYLNAISKGMYNRITKPGSKVIPKRSTVIALAINLGLNIMETLELLAPLKYTLNEAYKDDCIIIQGIEMMEDIDTINKRLIAFSYPPLVTEKED